VVFPPPRGPFVSIGGTHIDIDIPEADSLSYFLNHINLSCWPSLYVSWGHAETFTFRLLFFSFGIFSCDLLGFSIHPHQLST
jgi:hypothetical protein